MTNPRADLSPDLVKTLYSYQPETGLLIWVGSKQPTRNGKRAGFSHPLGHRYVRVGRHNYKEHRIAWLLYYGEWPKDQIDHVNGDPSDNRIGNLRAATSSQNQANKGIQKNNSTGFKGVGFRPDRGFFAVIKKDRKSHYLGSFATAEEAHFAYADAARRMHGEFARVA